MISGNIHSIETCGTVDGPGLRYVIFTQGCLLRCQYCHNADTWKIGSGKEMSVEQLMKDIKTYLPFMKSSGGGVTVSGGEPLLQLDFLLEMFKSCKKNGIHTTIDSSGGCFSTEPNFLSKLDEVLEYTDLVLLDLKHVDEKKHIKLTGKSNEQIKAFAKYLDKKKTPVWIRHVLVPGITDSEEDLINLGCFINTLGNVEKIEILPYHQLGVYKWEALGLKYPLKDIQPPTEESVNHAYQLLTNPKVLQSC
ncbi:MULTISPECIES: pyruvate formate-lyase-activating protein [unclassified Bacillus (in: firmicutes)]|uniref:pyruvate formate-lyase-activating protein n=1 Tax=unclassified Bacillus (in: firmicutes) TaxID=185979 RepID=UPI000BEF7A72|nr:MULTISPECIES: pyruvate formate-lyase-activating protein [unclassified Bacillus (in: firmicutes)]PEJ48738.1 pyruvate formate-lyase 1-activating enzyme [Bacillus sp. AFS002410]PEK98272.1 pyruvate formate-lyase 1-activating enzyme [Bacillus sp. AFS017336]